MMIHHQRLLDLAPDPLATVDIEGRLLACNAAWRKWVGPVSPEAGDQKISAWLPELDWSDMVKKLQGAADHVCQENISFLNFKGFRTHFHLNLQLASEGNVIDIIMTSRDKEPSVLNQQFGLTPPHAAQPLSGRASHNRLQDLEAMIQSLDDIVVEVDAGGKLLSIWTSPTDTQLFTSQDLRGSQLQELVNRDLARLLMTAIKQCLELQKVEVIEAPFDESELLWHRWKIIPIRNGSLASTRVAILIQDISENILSQQHIMRSEQKIRRILEASPDLKILVNGHGIITYASCLRQARSLGFMLGHALNTTTPVGKRLEEHLQLARRTCKLQEFEILMPRTENPSFVWLHVRIVTLGQEESGCLLVLRDITAERQQQQTIRVLSSLIDASPDLIFLCDESGSIEYRNQSARDFSQEGTHIRQLLCPEQYQQLIETAWPIVTRGQTWEGEMLLESSEGREPLPIWQRAFSLKEDGAELQLIALVGSDLRLRKTLEAHLVQSSKMASLGEMAGGLAHEINNPLAIIQGKITQLRRMSSESQATIDTFMQELQHIERNAERIAKIIRGLRSFARDVAKDPLQPQSVHRLIEETLDLCQERFLAQGIQINLELFYEGIVLCRPPQIQQVLLNVFHNAYDAVLDKPINQRRITVATRQTGDRIQIAISDTGSGIPAHITDRIMEPFFTTKDIGKGTGLGLSIAKGIIEDHGGSFFLDRQAPITRFVIELPACLARTSPQEDAIYLKATPIYLHPGA